MQYISSMWLDKMRLEYWCRARLRLLLLCCMRLRLRVRWLACLRVRLIIVLLGSSWRMDCLFLRIYWWLSGKIVRIWQSQHRRTRHCSWNWLKRKISVLCNSNQRTKYDDSRYKNPTRTKTNSSLTNGSTESPTASYAYSSTQQASSKYSK